MSVKVRIPSPLRSYTQGADVVEVPGNSVGEVLNALKEKAGGIETRLFKGPNQLNRFVNVYVNDEDIRFLKNLETPVKPGDELSIVPAIAGGERASSMPTLKLTDQQVTDLIRQLPPAQRRALLLTLAGDAAGGRQFRMQKAEGELRKLAAARNRNWDTMSESQREDFIDDLVHEGRGCT